MLDGSEFNGLTLSDMATIVREGWGLEIELSWFASRPAASAGFIAVLGMDLFLEFLFFELSKVLVNGILFSSPNGLETPSHHNHNLHTATRDSFAEWHKPRVHR